MEVGVSVLVVVDVGLLSLGIRNPFGKGEGSSDLLLLEVGEGLLEFNFEVEEYVVDLLGDVITGLSVLLGGGGQLDELGHGILLEDMAVHL